MTPEAVTPFDYAVFDALDAALAEPAPSEAPDPEREDAE